MREVQYWEVSTVREVLYCEDNTVREMLAVRQLGSTVSEGNTVLGSIIVLHDSTAILCASNLA